MSQRLPSGRGLGSIPRMLEKYMLHLMNEPSRVVAFTDRVGGFWDGQTFSRNQHEGYMISGRRYLKELYLAADETTLDPANAVSVDVCPHQLVQRWGEGFSAGWTVLQGEHGLIVTLKAERPVVWRVAAVFHEAPEQETVSTDGRMLRVEREAGDWQTGFRLDGPAKCTSLDAGAGPTRAPWEDARCCSNQLESEPLATCSLIILFDLEGDALERRLKEWAADPARAARERSERVENLLAQSWVETNDPEYDRALAWAKISANELVVKEFSKGIWAGLPWFHQGWGRDTFISLPGTSMVTGQFQDAADIIRGFAGYQITDPNHPLYGRIPNRVCSPTDIIYNTTDGTPWLIREIAEYVLWTGDRAFAEEMLPVVRRAIEGVLKHFTDEFGFMTHEDADTWMDAKLDGREAWSPRGNRAVDIQVLWHTQLEAGAWMARLNGHEAEAEAWQRQADRLKENFRRLFTDAEHEALFDHLNEDGSPDHQVRPNQLFALTIPLFGELIEPSLQSGVVHQVVTELTYPYGVASLAQQDAHFHPYHHNQIYHFDAAYHNGLCWQWNAGPAVGGMVKVGQSDLAFELTKNLAGQILGEGMPGSMSELVEPLKDDEGHLVLTGTYSQAWSVAEFVRNFYQDYLGIRVDMTERRLVFEPRLPKALQQISCVLTLGNKEQIKVSREGSDRIGVEASHLDAPLTLLVRLPDEQRAIHEISMVLEPGAARMLEVQDRVAMRVTLDGRDCRAVRTDACLSAPDPSFHFQTPRLEPDLQTLKVPDFLQRIIRPGS